LDPGRSLTIRLVDVTSSLPEGVAHLSVVCRDLLGFADTTLTVPVRKTTQCIAGLPIVNGGTIRWGGAKGRLAWSEPFYAVAPSGDTALGSGHIVIEQPETDLPAEHVHDGIPRSATADGVVLDQWEMLFAVHDLGRGWGPVSYRIVRMGDAYVTAGNWLLVATVNGSDDSIKLGTGATLGARGAYSGGSTVPNGMIMMWSGSVADIPAGWALCDNTRGTPDLRDRFIVGAGNRYQPTNTGGFDFVGLDVAEMPAHSHTATMDERGLHWHQIEGTNASGLSERDRILHGDTTVDLHWGGGSDADVGDEKWRGMASTDRDGAHTHTIGITPTGGGQAHENRPPFFALAFIMKI
jgi:microcystin-dependent protein